MAIHRNKTLAVLTGIVAMAGPACAQNYDYLSRSDGISLSAGDAPQANISIQTPTPWPPYVNNTRISGNGRRGADLYEMYLKRYSAQQNSNPSTVINITQPGQ